MRHIGVGILLVSMTALTACGGGVDLASNVPDPDDHGSRPIACDNLRWLGETFAVTDPEAGDLAYIECWDGPVGAWSDERIGISDRLLKDARGVTGGIDVTTAACPMQVQLDSLYMECRAVLFDGGGSSLVMRMYVKTMVTVEQEDSIVDDINWSDRYGDILRYEAPTDIVFSIEPAELSGITASDIELGSADQDPTRGDPDLSLDDHRDDLARILDGIDFSAAGYVSMDCLRMGFSEQEIGAIEPFGCWEAPTGISAEEGISGIADLALAAKDSAMADGVLCLPPDEAHSPENDMCLAFIWYPTEGAQGVTFMEYYEMDALGGVTEDAPLVIMAAPATRRASEAHEELGLEYLPGYGTSLDSVTASVIASDLVWSNPESLPGIETDCGDFDVAIDDDGSVHQETMACLDVTGADETFLAVEVFARDLADAIPGSEYDGTYCDVPLGPDYQCLGFVSNPAMEGWWFIVLTGDNSNPVMSAADSGIRFDGQWAVVAITKLSPAAMRDTLGFGTVARGEDGNLEWTGTVDLDP